MNGAILLGHRNRLEVLREVDFGLYLDAGEVGDVLLPRRYVPEGTQIGDIVDVFLYLDNDERLIATTETPLVEVGQFAYLEVKWTNEHGAFLDWGLMKDLFCPFPEQRQRMERGRHYLIYCYIDRVTYRIVASSRVERFLSSETPEFEAGASVDALVYQRTDLGYKAIVNQRYNGLIMHNEVFQPLHQGELVTAYVKRVREDGKIDLRMQRHFGHLQAIDFGHQLLDYLRQAEGHFCPLHDKSDAADIYETFGVSKKVFKRGVSDLYKHRLIDILPDGIQLVRNPSAEQLQGNAYDQGE